MNIKRFSVILSLFLATSVCVLADNVKISGKVIDNEDKPVEFATVKIAGTAIGTNTDLKGVYSLSVAATDTLKVVFSCIGFKTVTHQLIKPQGDLTLNVRLYPDDVTLQDVEVVSARTSTACRASTRNRSSCRRMCQEVRWRR